MSFNKLEAVLEEIALKSYEEGLKDLGGISKNKREYVDSYIEEYLKSKIYTAEKRIESGEVSLDELNLDLDSYTDSESNMDDFDFNEDFFTESGVGFGEGLEGLEEIEYLEDLENKYKYSKGIIVVLVTGMLSTFTIFGILKNKKKFKIKGIGKSIKRRF